MNPPVLGLDLSTHTGWAVRTASGRIESGVQEFDKRRGESDGIRFLRFRKWLNELIDLSGACKGSGIIGYEQAHHRGGYATALCVGLQTLVLETAAERGLEHVSVHTATLKKWATGSGRAGKEEMMAAAGKKHPTIELLDDNHADALLVLDWTIKDVSV